MRNSVQRQGKKIQTDFDPAPFSTNQVIEVLSSEKIEYYIPTYMRFKINSLISVSPQQLNAEVRGTLLITFGLKRFKEYVIRTSNRERYLHLYNKLTTDIILKFTKNQSIRLNSEERDPLVVFHQEEEFFTFVITQSFNFDIFPQNFYLCPFEQLRVAFSVKIDKVKTEFNGFRIRFYFNLMDLRADQNETRHLKDKLQKQINSLEILNEVKLDEIMEVLGEFKGQNFEDSPSLQGVSTLQYKRRKVTKLFTDIQAGIPSIRKSNFIKTSYGKTNKFGQYQMASKKTHQIYQPHLQQYFELRFDQQKQDLYNKKTTQHQSKLFYLLQLVQKLVNPYVQELLRQQENDSLVPPVSQHNLSELNSQQNTKNHGKFTSFQYGIFSFYFFKQPFADLATIFVPLQLLGLLNLAIFFQEDSISERLANIAALMIAFAALVPTLRDKLPPTSDITLIEIVIHLQALTSVMVLLQTFYIHGTGVSNGPLEKTLVQVMFFFSLSFNIISVAIVFTLYFLFFCKWRSSYIYKDQNVGFRSKGFKKNKNSERPMGIFKKKAEPICEEQEKAAGKLVQGMNSFSYWTGHFCDKAFYQYQNYLKMNGSNKKFTHIQEIMRKYERQ